MDLPDLRCGCCSNVVPVVWSFADDGVWVGSGRCPICLRVVSGCSSESGVAVFAVAPFPVIPPVKVRPNRYPRGL